MMDTFFFHGRVWQGKGRFAQAILVRRGRIALVGETEALRPHAQGCAFIDCGGRTVIPGIQDGGLFLAAAWPRAFPPCGTAEELARAGSLWLDGHPRAGKKGFYSCIRWGAEPPPRAWLDALCPAAPAVVEDVGHGWALANTAACDLLEGRGIPPRLEPGIWRDGAGKLTGRFYGPACRLAAAAMPLPSQRERRTRLEAAHRRTAAQGVTAVRSLDLDVTLPREVLPVLSELCRGLEGLPRLRMTSRPAAEGSLPCRRLGLPEQGPGPLRSGVFLSENGPGGAILDSGEHIARLWNETAARGLPLTVWTGEGSGPDVRTCWERTGQRPGNRLRCALAGCRRLAPETLHWAGEQGMGALFFPSRWDDRPGEDRWQLRTLSALGAHTAVGGLDECAPFAHLARLCRRRDPETGEISREALSRETALECLTAGAAWMDFQEDFLGRLAPGYGADLLVLDRDVFSCPEEEMADIRPLLVMTAGALALREI